MAIDQTTKALNIAARTIDASDRVIKALYDLVAIERERGSSGLILTLFDTAFSTSAGTRHASGADYQAALTSAALIKTFIETNFHTTNLDKVRP